MSISQKSAWIQFLIFASVVAGWAVLFAFNGTVFYWLDETMKMIFLLYIRRRFCSFGNNELDNEFAGRKKEDSVGRAGQIHLAQGFPLGNSRVLYYRGHTVAADIYSLYEPIQ